MKKTIIALLALAGVAAGSTSDWTVVNTYTPDTPYTLQQGTGGTALTFDPILSNGNYFISSKVNNNTSPAIGKLEMDFVLTKTDLTATLVAVSSNAAPQAGWGVTVKDGNLYFGQMSVQAGNTTSAMSSYQLNCTDLGAITLNTNYTLTLVSWGSDTGGTLAGRGTDNFQITLMNTDNNTAIYNGYVGGFALNSDGLGGLAYIELGGSNSASETAEFGSVSRVTLYIPEPATATLSLLALAGLAARRRRK